MLSRNRFLKEKVFPKFQLMSSYSFRNSINSIKPSNLNDVWSKTSNELHNSSIVKCMKTHCNYCGQCRTDLISSDARHSMLWHKIVLENLSPVHLVGSAYMGNLLNVLPCSRWFKTVNAHTNPHNAVDVVKNSKNYCCNLLISLNEFRSSKKLLCIVWGINFNSYGSTNGWWCDGGGSTPSYV